MARRRIAGADPPPLEEVEEEEEEDDEGAGGEDRCTAGTPRLPGVFEAFLAVGGGGDAPAPAAVVALLPPACTEARGAREVLRTPREPT